MRKEAPPLTTIVFDELAPFGPLDWKRYNARVYRWGLFAGVDHVARCQAQGEPLAGIAAVGLR